MPIGITEDHAALQESVRGWVERHCPPSVTRAGLDDPSEARPPFWAGLAEQGWLGLAVPEADGGSGFGVGEVVVVVEELGRACAPGPALATLLTIEVVRATTNGDARTALLPELASGTRTGAVVGHAATRLRGTRTDAGLTVSGSAGPVLSAHLADLVVAPVAVAAEDGGSEEVWVALEVRDGVTVRELPSVDLTRRVGEIEAEVTVDAAHVLTGVTGARVADASAALLAAELVGVAQWCVDTASAYAKDRIQFGRPIGQFQGVKHKCADMLGRVELARAAAWDAARAVDDGDAVTLATSAALALALDAAYENAKDCVQVHGGIGFTWEHDAHLYLRRAMAMRSLAGEPSVWRTRAARCALAGDRRALSVDLGPDAEALRTELQAFLAEVGDLEPYEQRRRVADAGYLTPTWPAPWGRAARAVEQMVIDQEFRAARVPRPSIVIGAWALPPVIMYGTEEQQQR